MSKATKAEPKMWGTSIVGFGKYHYTGSASGRGGDPRLTGFASRKAAISIYLVCVLATSSQPFWPVLGSIRWAKGVLYVKRLADVDRTILAKLIKMSIEEIKRHFP